MNCFVSEKINKYLIEKKIVNEENKELVAFGIHDIIMYFLTLLPIFCFSLLVGTAWQCLIFLIGYMPLRIYAGGYHAKTELRCYFASVLQVTAVLVVLKWVPWTALICIIIMCCSAIVILALAPLEDKNKPLCAAEKSAYKKRTRIILVVEAVIILVSAIMGWVVFAACLGLVLLTVTISILLSVMKKAIISEEKQTVK